MKRYLYIILITLFIINFAFESKAQVTYDYTKIDQNNVDNSSSRKFLKRLYYFGVINKDLMKTAQQVQIKAVDNPWDPLTIKELEITIDGRRYYLKDDDISIIEKVGPRFYYDNLVDENLNTSGLGLTGTALEIYVKGQEILSNLKRISKAGESTVKKFPIDYNEFSWLIKDQNVVNQIIYKYNEKLSINGREDIPDYYKELLTSVNKVIILYGSKDKSENLRVDSIQVYNEVELAFDPKLREPIFDTIYDIDQLDEVAKQPQYWTRTVYDYYLLLNAYLSEVSFYDSRNVDPFSSSSDSNPYEGTRYSAFAQWGFEPLMLYGYYSDEAVVGVDFSTYSLRRLFHPFIDIKLGFVFQQKRPFTSVNPIGNLYSSGFGGYLKIASPIPFVSSYSDYVYNNMQLTFESKFTLQSFKKERFEENFKFDFYNYTNYLNFGIRVFPKELKHIDVLPFVDVGNLEFDLSVLLVDLRQYTFDPFDLSTTKIVAKDPNAKNKFEAGFNFGVSLVRPFGNLQYNLGLFVNQTPWKTTFFGSKIDVLINDWIGFSTKIAFTSKSASELDPWLKDIYIMFSPTIKLKF